MCSFPFSRLSGFFLIIFCHVFYFVRPNFHITFFFCLSRVRVLCRVRVTRVRHGKEDSSMVCAVCVCSFLFSRSNFQGFISAWDRVGAGAVILGPVTKSTNKAKIRHVEIKSNKEEKGG